MEATKIVITGKPLVDLDSIPELLDGVVEDAVQQVVAEMRVMINKYSPAEAAQIATSSPY